MGDKSVPAKDRDWSGAIGQAVKEMRPVSRRLIKDVDRADLIKGLTEIQKSKKKKYVFDSSSARKKDLTRQAYRASVEKKGGKVKFADEFKKGGKV